MSKNTATEWIIIKLIIKCQPNYINLQNKTNKWFLKLLRPLPNLRRPLSSFVWDDSRRQPLKVRQETWKIRVQHRQTSAKKETESWWWWTTLKQWKSQTSNTTIHKHSTNNIIIGLRKINVKIHNLNLSNPYNCTETIIIQQKWIFKKRTSYLVQELIDNFKKNFKLMVLDEMISE